MIINSQSLPTFSFRSAEDGAKPGDRSQSTPQNPHVQRSGRQCQDGASPPRGTWCSSGGVTSQRRGRVIYHQDECSLSTFQKQLLDKHMAFRCSLNVHWTFRNKFQRILNRSTNIFIERTDLKWRLPNVPTLASPWCVDLNFVNKNVAINV